MAYGDHVIKQAVKSGVVFAAHAGRERTVVFQDFASTSQDLLQQWITHTAQMTCIVAYGRDWPANYHESY